MFKFLRKDEDDADGGKALPVEGGGQVASIAIKSGVKKDAVPYDDVDDIPDHDELLTASGHPSFAVPEVQHQQVAAVRQGSSALLLATEEFSRSDEYLSLRQRLRSKFADVREATATPTVLLSLYSQTASGGKRVDRRDDEDPLSRELFQSQVTKGIRARCTDIHIVIMEDAPTAVVLHRIDGLICLADRIPQVHALAAVGVAFNKLADKGTRSDGTFIPGRHQYAKIPVVVDGDSYNLRFQSLVVAGGLRVILRTLETSKSKNSDAKTFEQLGYSRDQCRLLHNGSRRTKGGIFIAGPTGSGKSTTLKTMMMSSPTRHRRIQITVEDPVEYKIFGAGQVSVQRSAKDESDVDMNAAMRAILRSDPDELMVGEIKDPEMAELLEGFILSGHKSLTSVHTTSAFEIVIRLASKKLGISRDAMEARNFLSLLIYQNLVPVLCENCRIPATEASEEQFPSSTRQALRDIFKVNPDRMFVTNECGCEICGFKGTVGQTVVAEVVPPDDEMRRLFGAGKNAVAEKKWREGRKAAFDEEDCTGKTALEHGIYKACLGMIDPVVLESFTEPFETYQVVESSKE